MEPVPYLFYQSPSPKSNTKTVIVEENSIFVEYANKAVYSGTVTDEQFEQIEAELDDVAGSIGALLAKMTRTDKSLVLKRVENDWTFLALVEKYSPKSEENETVQIIEK